MARILALTSFLALSACATACRPPGAADQCPAIPYDVAGR